MLKDPQDTDENEEDMLFLNNAKSPIKAIAYTPKFIDYPSSN